MNYEDYVIETVNLGMRFGSFDALKNITLRLDKNKVHALLGENGAGKSTLVNCLVGSLMPTEGQYSLFGMERRFKSPRESHKLGIGMVHQHFTLVEKMTVAENFLLVYDPIPFRINWEKEKKAISAFMESMPFRLEVDRLVENLSAGEKQKLEILKQLYFQRTLLILDEPTSVLNPGEADEVLGYLRQQCHQKKLTVLMITHKFREVMNFADDVTILRKGQLVGHYETADVDEKNLAVMMVGDSASDASVSTRTALSDESEIKFSFNSVSCNDSDQRPLLRDLSFNIREGEIYGVAGVSGNGQKGIVEILTGSIRDYRGVIESQGESFVPKKRFLNKNGIRIIPEMPLQNAAAPDMSVQENLAMRNYDQSPIAGKAFFYSRKAMAEQADRLIEEFQINTPSGDKAMRQLSGGNVQRAVLARELQNTPDILIVANPCFGLDFAATDAIQKRILKAREEGCAVLYLSDDLDEIFLMSDRIGVLFEGEIIYEASADKTDRLEVGRYMAGGFNAKEYA